ncbi:MAG: DoxX family protein [Nanoarchaeota archaeon]|nr:DoxX family protein [Nanoarchaeota archaeon]
MGLCEKSVQKYGDVLYVLFRVLVGLGFMLHGGQKLFGWFGGVNGGGAVALVSLFGLAGVIEFFGGLAVLLGFFTRLGAGIAALEMLVAYMYMHRPQGWIPLLNGGEAAWLYFAAFLVLLVYGSGKWSLEKKLLKKEVF